MEIGIVRFELAKEVEEYEDIILCLNTLFSVRTGSIPLSRQIGLEGSAISGIAPVIETNLYYDIMEKVETYESRVIVNDITFDYDYENGYVLPTVKLSLAQESEVNADE